jgi:hypothetical protein
MNKLLMILIFVVCYFLYACNNDCTLPIIIEKEPYTVPDSCDGINPVACSFEFRKGKWLEVQDSIDAQSVLADTIWFIEDSLVGWSFEGEPYRILKGYFRHNQILTQPWNSGGQGPVASSGTYTTYNDTTELLSIYWRNQLDPFYHIDYVKIE